MTVPTLFRNMARMFKNRGETVSLALLHKQSVDLILHARRLQQEFTELREASKLLRLESMQLRDDVKLIRKSSVALFTNAD